VERKTKRTTTARRSMFYGQLRRKTKKIKSYDYTVTILNTYLILISCYLVVIFFFIKKKRKEKTNPRSKRKLYSYYYAYFMKTLIMQKYSIKYSATSCNNNYNVLSHSPPPRAIVLRMKMNREK